MNREFFNNLCFILINMSENDNDDTVIKKFPDSFWKVKLFYDKESKNNGFYPLIHKCTKKDLNSYVFIMIKFNLYDKDHWLQISGKPIDGFTDDNGKLLLDLLNNNSHANATKIVTQPSILRFCNDKGYWRGHFDVNEHFVTLYVK